MNDIFNHIEKKIGKKIINRNSIGGGCIGNSMIITLSGGNKLFLKTYGSSSRQIICEANGLKELAKQDFIKVPKVILYRDDFILLENIETSFPGKDFFEKFGRNFAKMHRVTSGKFGFFENNFIGSNPQINLPQSSSWAEFYFNNRILYQFRLAEQNGYIDSSLRGSFSKFEKVLFSILEETKEKPALLHGDLWSGNFLCDKNQNAVIIDPAVYYGNREADIAMTLLFGGFNSSFYGAYNEEFPFEPGWRERVDIYKLYHVLNHLNLFGTGYLSQTKSIIRKYI